MRHRHKGIRLFGLSNQEGATSLFGIVPRFAFLSQVLLCAVLWGTAFPFIKVVYGDWETVTLTLCLFFAGVRFTMAGAGLLLLCSGLGRTLRQADLRLLGLLALTQTCLQYCCFYVGMVYSSGVLGALLVGCGSFWWILLAPVILKTERPRPNEWVALMVSTVGIVVAVYAPGVGSGKVWLGALCFLSASFFGALALIIMRPLSKTMDAKSATGVSLLLGGMVLMALGMPSAGAFWATLTPQIALITVVLAVVSAVSFSIWNRLAHTHSVNMLASYRFLIPLSGAIQSSLFIGGEFPGLGIWIGGSLILGALVSLNRPLSRSLSV